MVQSVSTPMLDAVKAHIQSDLAPLTQAIDQEGYYPGDYLQGLGARGGFGSAIAPEQGGQGLSLADQIDVTTAVGATCGATAFLVWCQSVCAWYLHHSPNHAVRERYLSPVARGELLCGTGMSNTVKHLSGIEKMHLKAQRQGSGYLVDGVLPWVSNLSHRDLLIVTAEVENEGYVMFIVHGDAQNLAFKPCPSFSGMEGTGTFNVRFQGVSIDADNVLAHPEQFATYMDRIKPGFIISQAAMGFGVVEGSLDTIRQANQSRAEVNGFLDDQEEELAAELQSLKHRAAHLAARTEAGDAPLLEVLKVRAGASELALRAAQSAALHIGARGYLMRHPAQRRQREALFVAIVTPALKHLRKEINSLEAAPQQREVSGW